jgi:subtilisin
MAFELPSYDILNYFQNIETIDYNVKLLGADSYWSKTKGQGVTVAILDTGIDTDHPDLQPNLRLALDFTHDKNPEDTVGHGTHCAGIVAGCDNGLGIVGVAPRAGLISLKVLSQSKGNSSTLARALRWVIENHIEHKIRIVSMSLGSDSYDFHIEKLISQLKDMGVIVICAAGNDGQGSLFHSTINFPARLAAKGLCISIGAVDSRLDLAGFSSTGSSGEVTFVSPGVEVYSTFLNGQYIKLSGTSMATPAIAGFVALILATHPEIDTLEEVILKLKSLSRGLGPIEKFGFGMPRFGPGLM